MSRIGRVEGVDRVAQAALLAHLLEQPRRHAAAEHVGEHLQAEAAGDRVCGTPSQRQRDMHLLEVARLDPRAAAERRRLRRRRGRADEAGEALLDLGDDRVVIDRAGGRDHHVRRRGNCA